MEHIAQWQALIDGIPLSVLVIDRNGDVVAANSASARRWQSTAKELIGKSLVQLLQCNGLRSGAGLANEDDRRGNRTLGVEDRGCDSEVHGSIVSFGAESYQILTFVDQTEAMLAQNRHTRLIKKLESLRVSLAHDCKAKLITINGFADLLKRHSYGHDLGRMREDLDRITEAVTSLSNMITELGNRCHEACD